MEKTLSQKMTMNGRVNNIDEANATTKYLVLDVFLFLQALCILSLHACVMNVVCACMFMDDGASVMALKQ